MLHFVLINAPTFPHLPIWKTFHASVLWENELKIAEWKGTLCVCLFTIKCFFPPTHITLSTNLLSSECWYGCNNLVCRKHLFCSSLYRAPNPLTRPVEASHTMHFHFITPHFYGARTHCLPVLSVEYTKHALIQIGKGLKTYPRLFSCLGSISRRQFEGFCMPSCLLAKWQKMEFHC